MRVKSALMTTAADLVDGSGNKVADPYAQGAGRVVPERMFSPGLVYDAGEKDWDAYLAGLGKATDPATTAIDPSDYNSASIAIGNLVGTQTVTRRMTAVSAGSYQVSASIKGIGVDVSPSVLQFDRAGQTKTFRVRLTVRTTSYDQGTSGFLTWKSRRSSVRIPVVVTPRAVDAPRQVNAMGSSGSVSFKVTPGQSGTFTAAATGLATGTPRPTGGGSFSAGDNWAYLVPIPAGTKVARFTVRTPNTGANIDMIVYRYINGVATEIARVTTPSPNESYVLPTPIPGDYALQLFDIADAPGTTSTPFTAQTGLVQPGSGSGDFAVTPSKVEATAGEPIELTATWTGQDDSTPSVGWIEYPNGQGTAVSVN